MTDYEKYFIGVDLGTNGIKAGIIDMKANILGSSYWETELRSLGAGRMEQDIDQFYILTLKIIKDVIDKTGIPVKDIEGLAIDSQMGGIIGIDEGFNSITGLDMGLDVSAEKYNSLIHRDYLKQLLSISCGSPRNIPKIMWWKNEYPEVYKKISRFVTLNGYVIGKMCGLKASQALIDYTLIAFFGNEDAAQLKWSNKLSSIFDIDIGKLPRIVEPWSEAGRLSAFPSEATGLMKGIPVMVGAGDQAAGFIGAGLLDTGSIIDVSGSSTILSLTVNKYRPDIGQGSVNYIPSVIKGKYHALHYINGGGIALRWFRDQFLQHDNGSQREDPYGEIEKKANIISAGSEGLLFIPYMGGRQGPYSETIRGSWIGLNWGHKKEHMYRAIMEGLAYDYRLGIESLTRLFPEFKIKKILLTGGSSKSELFNQIKADVSGMEFIKIIEQLFAIRGSGIIAGHGTGAFPDILEISNNITLEDDSKIYKPENARKQIYMEYFKAFKNIMDTPLKDTFSSLSRIRAL